MVEQPDHGTIIIKRSSSIKRTRLMGALGGQLGQAKTPAVKYSNLVNATIGSPASAHPGSSPAASSTTSHLKCDGRERISYQLAAKPMFSVVNFRRNIRRSFGNYITSCIHFSSVLWYMRDIISLVDFDAALTVDDLMATFQSGLFHVRLGRRKASVWSVVLWAVASRVA